MKNRNYISLKGNTLKLDVPKVMGVVNVTPDSFYKESRVQSRAQIIESVTNMIDEGVDIVDVGAYSSRPGAEDISLEEELLRITFALEEIRKVFPDIVISLDTFRYEVARSGIDNFGVAIINDISGGGSDMRIFDLVAEKSVAYILMHMQGTPRDMQLKPTYTKVLGDITGWFKAKINELSKRGVSEIIVDPGFGFGKTIEQNYQILNELEQLRVFGLPVMVGLSRKSMIWKHLDISPKEALNGTSVLNTIALLKGASLLRVHDVKEAVQTIKLFQSLKASRE